ncbi:hypothetical protein R3P38DRAFT_3593687 [Favolaschia claudopus]|uniref:Uncharacterized protein n=1 Tax=Favolaschia claudopus TaxID=2862362 RepID=A0AAW0DJD6_9AGAR
MSTNPSNPIVTELAPFKGSLASMKKKELEQITQALSVKPNTGNKNKDGLIRLIKTTLVTISPDLRNNPRYSALYEDNKELFGGPTTVAALPKSQKNKNSAHKTAEDLADADKTQNKVTGAALKLQQGRVTVDPPAGHEFLKSNSENPGNLNWNNGRVSSPLSPVSSRSSPGPPEIPEDEGSEAGEIEKPARSARTTPQSVDVVMNVRAFSSDAEPAQEIVLSNVPVREVVLSGGNVHTEAHVSHLLSMTINNSSPIKAKGTGRFYRSGAFNPDARMDLGTVAQHSAQATPQDLEWDAKTTVDLKRINGQYFSAELFFDSQGGKPIQPITSLTGAGTDQPLEIARNRAVVGPKASSVIKATSGPELFDFIRAVAGSNKLPEIKNDTAAAGRLNYIAFQKFMQPCLQFKGKKEGMVVPENWIAPAHVAEAYPDWASFRNKSFTKDDITLAAGFRTTSNNITNSVFQKIERLGGGMAKWAKEEGVDGDSLREEERERLNRKYGMQKWGKFKKSIEAAYARALEDSDDSPPGPSKRKAKATVVSDSDDSSDDDVHKKKKQRKEKRASRKQREKERNKAHKTSGKDKGKQVDSDDLDGSQTSSDD